MQNSFEKNRRFKSKRGNDVVVWQEFEMGRNATGFAGRAKCVRTFAEVNGKQVEMEAGCSFQAESAVFDAGF